MSHSFTYPVISSNRINAEGRLLACNWMLVDTKTSQLNQPTGEPVFDKGT